MKTGIKVIDAMTTKPVMCSPDIPIWEAAKVMKKNEVGSLLVVGKDKGFLGIVTETDFLRRAIVKKLPLETTLVSEIMTKKVTFITPEKDIFDAMIVMKNGGFRRLPVVEDEKAAKPRVLGILTLKDILKIEPALLDNIADEIEIREEERKPIAGSDEEDVCQICNCVSRNLVRKRQMNVCRICARTL